MKSICHTILVGSIALMVHTQTYADDLAVSGNPYSTIVSRNIFSLVDMPTNPPVAPPPSDPPPKITPNGIMSLFGQFQVLFKVATPPKTGQPPTDQSYVLSTGERQDEIEVTKIDDKNGIITFNNHGVIQELSLTNANLSTPSAPGGGAGASGFARPPGLPVPNRFGGARFGNMPNPGNQPTANNNPTTSASPNFGNGTAASSVPGENLSPEAQVIAIEAERARLQQSARPEYSPALLPPTALTQQLQDEQGNNPQPPAP